MSRWLLPYKQVNDILAKFTCPFCNSPCKVNVDLGSPGVKGFDDNIYTIHCQGCAFDASMRSTTCEK